MPSRFLDVLCVNDINELLKNVEDFLCVTICLPHIKQFNQDLAIKHLKNVLLLLCSSLERTSDDVESIHESDLGLSKSTQLERKCNQSEERIRVLLLVLPTVLETLIHLTDSKSLKEACSLDMLVKSVLPYACDHANLDALRALDLYLTACKPKEEEDAYSLQLFGRLYSKLLQNLSSPFHKVRSDLPTALVVTFFHVFVCL